MLRFWRSVIHHRDELGRFRAEARTELGEIASAVLGIGSNEHEALMKELAEGRFGIVEPTVKDTQGSDAPSGHP
jgi:hypothetical protein